MFVNKDDYHASAADKDDDDDDSLVNRVVRRPMIGIEHTGWLTKKGRKNPQSPQWKERFFILNSDKKLLYFKSPASATAIGEIVLPESSVRVITRDNGSDTGIAPFLFANNSKPPPSLVQPNIPLTAYQLMFEIDTKQRLYTLRAPNSDEYNGWMRRLLQCCSPCHDDNRALVTLSDELSQQQSSYSQQSLLRIESLMEFDACVSDSVSVDYFVAYESDHGREANLQCLLDCREFSTITSNDSKSLREKSNQIVDSYLTNGARYEVAVDQTIRNTIRDKINTDDLDLTLFDALYALLINKIQSLFFPAFLESDLFYRAVTAPVPTSTSASSSYNRGSSSSMSGSHHQRSVSHSVLARSHERQRSEFLQGADEEDMVIVLSDDTPTVANSSNNMYGNHSNDGGAVVNLNGGVSDAQLKRGDSEDAVIARLLQQRHGNGNTDDSDLASDTDEVRSPISESSMSDLRAPASSPPPSVPLDGGMGDMFGGMEIKSPTTQSPAQSPIAVSRGPSPNFPPPSIGQPQQRPSMNYPPQQSPHGMQQQRQSPFPPQQPQPQPQPLMMMMQQQRPSVNEANKPSAKGGFFKRMFSNDKNTKSQQPAAGQVEVPITHALDAFYGGRPVASPHSQSKPQQTQMPQSMTSPQQQQQQRPMAGGPMVQHPNQFRPAPPQQPPVPGHHHHHHHHHQYPNYMPQYALHQQARVQQQEPPQYPPYRPESQQVSQHPAYRPELQQQPQAQYPPYRPEQQQPQYPPHRPQEPQRPMYDQQGQPQQSQSLPQQQPNYGRQPSLPSTPPLPMMRPPPSMTGSNNLSSSSPIQQQSAVPSLLDLDILSGPGTSNQQPPTLTIPLTTGTPDVHQSLFSIINNSSNAQASAAAPVPAPGAASGASWLDFASFDSSTSSAPVSSANNMLFEVTKAQPYQHQAMRPQPPPAAAPAKPAAARVASADFSFDTQMMQMMHAGNKPSNQ